MESPENPLFSDWCWLWLTPDARRVVLVTTPDEVAAAEGSRVARKPLLRTPFSINELGDAASTNLADDPCWLIEADDPDLT